MNLLIIIGWIALIWLSGSFLYSTQFHLKNWLLRKHEIKSGEVSDFYKKIHKKMTLRLIFLQATKLVVVVVLLYFLL